MTLVKTPKPHARWRRWLLGAGVVLLAALAWFTVRTWDKRGRLDSGLDAMSRGEFGQAADIFDKAIAAYPGDKQFAFMAAVAHRRNADLRKFEESLRLAERLGEDLNRTALQRLLSTTQHGLGNQESEAEIDRLCEAGADDFTAEQIYEARAKGYMSLYRVEEAFRVLAYWIEWQPQAIVPRQLRAQLWEENDDLRRAEMDYQAIVDAHPDHLDARIRLAETLVLNRKHDAALSHYQQCAKLSPGDPRVEIGLAEIEYRAGGGDMTRVEKKLTELLAKSTDPNLRHRCWVALANIYLSRKENEKVVALLEDEASKGELDGPAFEALMRAYQRLNQREKAERYRKLQTENMARRDSIFALHQEVAQDSKNPIPRYRLGNLFFELGNKKAAITWWYTAILAEPLHQPSHEALASYFAAEGDTTKALQHRDMAEKSVDRTFALAWRDFELNDFDALERKLPFIAKYPAYKPHAELLRIGMLVKKTLELKPQDRRMTMQDLEPLSQLTAYPHLRNYALIVLGGGLYELGYMGEAEATLLDVISSDPNAIEAHRWLLSMNFDIRAFSRAQVHADTIARLDPSDYRPHRLLGLMAKVMQSWDLAIGYYEQALRRKPHEKIRQEILLELGECQTRARKYVAALKTLNETADSVERNILLAECLFFTGRAAEANPILDATLKSDPKNPSANLLKADVILEQKGDLELARQHAQTILDRFPFSDSAWFKLSQIYSRQNRPREAKEAGEKAAELKDLQIRYSRQVEVAVVDPDNIPVRQELSAIARQFGRTDLAEEWDRAIELLKSKEAATGGKKNDNPLQAGSGAPPRTIPLLVSPDLGEGAADSNLTEQDIKK